MATAAQGFFLDEMNRSKDAFTPGAPIVVDVDQGGKILDLSVIVRGTITLAAGTTSGTQVGDGLINLVKNIKLTGNPSSGSPYPAGDYVDCTPRSLLRYAMVQRQGKYMADMALSGAANLGNGAAGTYSFYIEYPIFFADPTSRTPMNTAFNADLGLWDSLQLQIDLASDLSGIFAGNDRTINAPGLAGLWVETKDSRLNLPGLTTPLIQHEHLFQIDSTMDRKVDRGMPTDGNFLQWMIMAEQNISNGYGTLSDGLLNKVYWQGTNGVIRQNANDIRARMYTDNWIDPAQSGTGLYFIDWVNGNNLNSNPAKGLSTEWDVNMVTGVNQDQFRVFTRRTLALKGQTGK
jgi:hypothetical protein